MAMNIRRLRVLKAGCFLGAVAALLLAAERSATAQPSEADSYIAVVTGNDVYVRSGAGESYYPFTKVNANDLVHVVGVRAEWARVATIGPVFQDSVGFIKHPKSDTSRFRLAPDGKTGTALGRLDIVAANLEAHFSPKESWKSIVKLQPNESVRVLETIEIDDQLIHKVALPETAQGWISVAYLQRATPAQVERWNQLLKEAASDEAAQKPASAPTRKPASTAMPTATTTTTPATATPPSQPAASSSPSTSQTAPAAPVTPGASSQQPVIAAPPAAGNAGAAVAADEDADTDDGEGEVVDIRIKANQGADLNTVSADLEAKKTDGAEKAKSLPSLDDLESAWGRLRKQPLDDAEIIPLREMYLDLARRSADKPHVVRTANGRAEQLQILLDAQEKRAKLKDLRARLKVSEEETIAAREALVRSAEYTAVGRIIASTIYNGQNLPRLLRLQDLGTGRTIAYIQPDEAGEVIRHIDLVVGIVGPRRYDEVLRLNVITPQRIDVLTAQPQGPQTAYTDGPQRPAADGGR